MKVKTEKKLENGMMHTPALVLGNMVQDNDARLKDTPPTELPPEHFSSNNSSSLSHRLPWGTVSVGPIRPVCDSIVTVRVPQDHHMMSQFWIPMPLDRPSAATVGAR